MLAGTLRCTGFFAAVLFGALCFGQTIGAPEVERAKLIVSVQRTAVAALNFREGDAAGFDSARAHFTSDGWKDFLAHMQGYLDAKGAPTFTSSFVVKRDARLLDEKDGVLHIRIPGTLTQSNKLGRTVYDPAAIEVHADRDGKIQRLEQVTCRGTSRACE